MFFFQVIFNWYENETIRKWRKVDDVVIVIFALIDKHGKLIDVAVVAEVVHEPVIMSGEEHATLVVI